MSIQYEFPSRHMIRIMCGNEIMEVVLPMGSSPADSAPEVDRGHGNPIGLSSTPLSGRPKQPPGVMAIITDKKFQPLDFDWTQVDPGVRLHTLERIGSWNEDELALYFKDNESQLEIAPNGLKIANVAVTPWSGTTPSQLENLRRIVESADIGIDAVRLFRSPDDDSAID